MQVSSLFVVFFSTPSFPAVQSIPPDSATKTKVLASYGKLPLSFIENKGQVNKTVSYYLKGRQGTIYFTQEGMVYDLVSAGPSHPKKTLPTERKRLSFTLKPIGANKDRSLIATDKLPGTIHYLIGNDPTKWKTQIPIYKEIVYNNLYTGIDLKIYGTNNQMEYDFIVSPGSEPANILLAFEGIDALTIDNKGDLIINTALTQLTHLKPIIYQVIDGKRYTREGSFKLAGNTVSFALGDYDTTYPLIIDPLTLSYSTYLGGWSSEIANGIAVDTAGNAYVAGYTYSSNFPTQNPYQGTLGYYSDAFVTKFNPNGASLSYSTYLGGRFRDEAYAIAVDTSGNAYVAGESGSTDFPTQNPYQGEFGGGYNDSDAFVTKLTPGGDTLSYSTYLGGSSDDCAYGIAIDTSGNAYVAGGTFSTDFPTQNPYQGEFGGGGDYGDAFVTKIIDEPNTPPTADITSPLNGSTYYEDDPISFNGSGYDAEDGPLTGSSLVWTSSIDGQIGTGESFIRNDLSVGTHTITLTATDSNGATGSDSVSITVTPGGIH